MTETLAVLSNGPAESAARFTLSASAGDNTLTPTAEFHRWWSERCQANDFQVRQIPFDRLDGWHFDPRSGNLAHDSVRFFTIEGLRIRGDGVSDWSQPIIHQPEIGVLGILVKEFDGVLHCLMQAKMEPGNINILQLSPTVQATRSNFTRVHKGATPLYLEHFLGAGRGRVLVDVLQSEQGAWFWHKHNRNMVVQVDGDVEEREDFRWLTVHQLRELLRIDNLVNMSARTALACMTLTRPDPKVGSEHPAFQKALLRSYESGPDAGSLHTHFEILSWFTDCKARCDMNSRLVPLNTVANWSRTGSEIVDDEHSRFRVIAVAVDAGNREVTRWSQPILAPHGEGLAAFLAKPIDGVLHLLVQARPEPGLLDVVEMAPTVQLPVAGAGWADPATASVPFAAEVATADPARVRYNVLLSEEGGRFHHAQTRYKVIEVDDSFPVEVPEGYCWMTVHQLMELLGHGHYLNVEARSLLACVHALW